MFFNAIIHKPNLAKIRKQHVSRAESMSEGFLHKNDLARQLQPLVANCVAQTFIYITRILKQKFECVFCFVFFRCGFLSFLPNMLAKAQLQLTTCSIGKPIQMLIVKNYIQQKLYD